MSQPGILISMENVKKRYSVGESGYWALKGINLQVQPGDFIAIVGKSGSGKSTMLNLLGGIDQATEGRICFQDRELSDLSENQLSRLRREQIGFVFQFFQLMPTLTVLENLMLPMDYSSKFRGPAKRQRAEMLLQKVGIAGQAHKFPAALSGGEQQRVAIARALANDPALILADEPTGNLDSQTTEGIFHLLETLTVEGKNVIMVTHNDELAARCRRIIRIRDGLITEDRVQQQERS